MSTNKIDRNQEDFITQALRFNASKKYFGGISSNDLNQAYGHVKRQNYNCKNTGFGNPDHSWRLLHVNNFTDADVAQALREQMEFNPLRWQEISSLYYSYAGVGNMLHMKDWYKENSGGELYEFLHEAYIKGVLKLHGNVEINTNKNASTYKNYWALRNLFNAFKTVCDTNIQDFKDPKYRDAIIVAANEKFPGQVNLRKFGFIEVPEKYPIDLFTKWNWEKQR